MTILVFFTDVFNVPSLDSHQNYHREFSAQGPTHPASYRYIHKTADGQKITFIGVDATPNPGVRRPFNFFGMLSDVSIGVFCFFYYFILLNIHRDLPVIVLYEVTKVYMEI